MTKRIRAAKTQTRHELYVYDGYECIGSIIETEEGCQTFNAAGKLVGKFKDRKNAMRAIDPAAESVHTAKLNRVRKFAHAEAAS